MKQIIISIMTISLVSLMIVGGAFASWSDTETSEGNYISAGTLDLVVNAQNPLTSALVQLDNLCPGEYQEVDVQITNEGSQPGSVWLMFTDLVCGTGAFVEPEAAAEAGTPVDDLCSQIQVSVNGVVQGTMAAIDGVPIAVTTLQPDQLNGSGHWVTLGFELLETAGNVYQGDVCEFTLVFGMEQAPH